MDSRTALVFGATGLIGQCLVAELVNDDTYSVVRVFVRKAGISYDNEKISEYLVDFENLNSYSDLIAGDDIFIATGTTIKKAGSVEKMEEIDRDLPVKLASIASANRVSRLAVVSSIGADAASRNYYLRIKGEMENKILALNFRTVAIMRPSILLGDRGEKRFGETAGKIIMKIFGPFFAGKFRKYRAIEAKTVARAMIKLLKDKAGKDIYESDTIQKIADSVS
jgi:uncharacterized protein YbjT (DUF2867 family)